MGSNSNVPKRVTPGERATIELDRYHVKTPEALDSNNTLEWWERRFSQYTYLAQLAKKILCITATSVPSEGVFSAA